MEAGVLRKEPNNCNVEFLDIMDTGLVSNSEWGPVKEVDAFYIIITLID